MLDPAAELPGWELPGWELTAQLQQQQQHISLASVWASAAAAQALKSRFHLTARPAGEHGQGRSLFSCLSGQGFYAVYCLLVWS